MVFSLSFLVTEGFEEVKGKREVLLLRNDDDVGFEGFTEKEEIVLRAKDEEDMIVVLMILV